MQDYNQSKNKNSKIKSNKKILISQSQNLDLFQ